VSNIFSIPRRFFSLTPKAQPCRPSASRTLSARTSTDDGLGKEVRSIDQNAAMHDHVGRGSGNVPVFQAWADAVP
jgi:hypothetical protein